MNFTKVAENLNHEFLKLNCKLYFDRLTSLITISSCIKSFGIKLSSVCQHTHQDMEERKYFFAGVLNISEVTVVIGNLRGERNY